MKTMKTMKTKLTLLIAVFALISVFMPNVKAEAAVTKPNKPKGLGLYLADLRVEGENAYGYVIKNPDCDTFILDWNYDASLMYTDYGAGYEVVIETLKNKKIKKIDSASNPYIFGVDKSGKMAVSVKNSKMTKQGFKFKVRAFVYDETGSKVYGAYSSEKVIVPRAKIKKMSLVSGNVKISWQKITGAKNYTVYLSTNGTKFSKKITTSGTSATLKSLKKNQDYYVYVQVNGVKYKKKSYNSTKTKAIKDESNKFKITTYTY